MYAPDEIYCTGTYPTHGQWSDRKRMDCDHRYVRAAIADEHKRQRDWLLSELVFYYRAAEQAWGELNRQGDPDLISAGRKSLDATAALVAECGGTDDG